MKICLNYLYQEYWFAYLFYSFNIIDGAPGQKQQTYFVVGNAFYVSLLGSKVTSR